MTVFLASIKQKKDSSIPDHVSLFLVRDGISKKEMFTFLRDFDDDLDLRTIRWEEFDNSGTVLELKKNIVPIESQLGTVTLT
jgi:hypothetical protein